MEFLNLIKPNINETMIINIKKLILLKKITKTT